MPGYSGTRLPAKLGIKDGHTVVLVGVPDDFGTSDLSPLPEGITLTNTLPRARQADVIVLFCRSRKALLAGFERAARSLTPAGGLWICWPKKSSGIATDITENDIRDYGLAVGLVDNKVCAVTEIWSGLRFVYRLEDRAKLDTTSATQRAKPTDRKASKISPSRGAGPATSAGLRPARSATPRARKS